MNAINSRFVRMLLLSLIVVSLALVGCSKESADDTQATSQPQTTAGKAVQKAKVNVAALSNPNRGHDPVCEMAIDEDAVVVTLASGKKYGFCSEHCAEQFKANPSKYDEHAMHGHD